MLGELVATSSNVRRCILVFACAAVEFTGRCRRCWRIIPITDGSHCNLRGCGQPLRWVGSCAVLMSDRLRLRFVLEATEMLEDLGRGPVGRREALGDEC